jgi:hypothetical protein
VSDVSEKVRRLLALASDAGAAPAEVAAALSKARQLMAEMDAAELARFRRRPSAEIEERASTIQRHEAAEWMQLCAVAVTRAMRSEVVWHNGVLYFVGFPEDLDVVQAAVAFATQAGATYAWLWQLDHGRPGKAALESWFRGYVDGLSAAFTAQDAANPGMALVLATPPQVTEHMERYARSPVVHLRLDAGDAAARRDGRATGEAIGQTIQQRGRKRLNAADSPAATPPSALPEGG